MTFWQIDDTAPAIDPETALDYYGKLIPGADITLPRLLVATFQSLVLDHLAARLDVAELHRWPTPVFFPLGKATLGERPVAIARLPIGAPAAASALELMIAAGVRTALLVGSAGSIQPGLPSGSLVAATRAIRHEGVSHHYLAPDEVAQPSPRLLDALIAASTQRNIPLTCGPLWTTDAPYRECRGTIERLREEGVLGVEMEAAALFAVAQHRGAEIALVAAVSDELGDEWKPAFHTLSYRRAILNAADLAVEAAKTL